MRFNKDMIAKAPKTAALLKLLSNPNRLMIVCRLLDGEMSVGDIEHALDIRQPTLSRELGHLRDADIISPRRQSKVVFYSLTNAPMRHLIEAICKTDAAGQSPEYNHEDRHDGAINTARPLAFNPNPKFTNSEPPLSGERGYSVFASPTQKGS